MGGDFITIIAGSRLEGESGSSVGGGGDIVKF